MAQFRELTIKKYLLVNGGLFIFLLISVAAGLVTGTADVSLGELFRIFTGNSSDPVSSSIILDIRLPRVLLAAVVGGGLSIAGAVFQSMLMNPLAEPYILGISSGGAFGAALSFILGLSFAGTQALAFAGALAVVAAVFMLSKKFGELEPNVLLLSGVMIGAFFSALILLLITMLENSLRNAVVWMIGNLTMASGESLIYVAPVIIIASAFLIYNANKFNLLSLGSENAKSLGVNTPLLKNSSYIAASLITGAAVSVSGIIGFVGLMIPHVCRMLFGPDNRIIVPASLLLGASYLILADLLARTIAAPAELPVGAITAIIGAPVFIYLLRKRFFIFA